MYFCSKTITPALVVYNPASFDPEAVLPARLRKFAAYARWFVHTIYTHRIFDRRGEADYVPLHAAHLRKVLPQDYYRDIIAALIDGGVVETDGYWVRGEKSKGFRLAGGLQDEEHARHAVEHPMLAKKLKAGRERRAAEITLDVHKHLWRHLRELQIDLSGVNTNQPRLTVPADCVRDGQWFMRVYLIRARGSEIRALPAVVEHLDDHPHLPQEALWLIGWWLSRGTTYPRRRKAAWMSLHRSDGCYWSERVRDRLAVQVELVRHWKAELRSYDDIPDTRATWFVDPPYRGKVGRHYAHKFKDHEKLAGWCRSRSGQVIVCEHSGADWLPFVPLGPPTPKYEREMFWSRAG